jgi:hypothetical protein
MLIVASVSEYVGTAALGCPVERSSTDCFPGQESILFLFPLSAVVRAHLLRLIPPSLLC